MKYEKNQYSDGASVCGFIIAGAFIYWGISDLIRLWWFGLIWLGIGAAIAASQIAAIANRDKLRKAVKYEFETNTNATNEEISTKTGISLKDVQAIILDLKMAGELRGNFSTKTGQLKPAPEQEKSGKKITYCPNCGAKMKEGAAFCSYCGSKN